MHSLLQREAAARLPPSRLPYSTASVTSGPEMTDRALVLNMGSDLDRPGTVAEPSSEDKLGTTESTDPATIKESTTLRRKQEKHPPKIPPRNFSPDKSTGTNQSGNFLGGGPCREICKWPVSLCGWR